jgi:hypothetical protein
MSSSDHENSRRNCTHKPSILHHNNVHNYRDHDLCQALCVQHVSETSVKQRPILAKPRTGPYCSLSNFGSFPILLEPSRVIGNVRTMISSNFPHESSCSTYSTLTSSTDVYNIPVDEIHLEYSGQPLYNTDTLDDHGIKHDSIINVCTSGISPRDGC